MTSRNTHGHLLGKDGTDSLPSQRLITLTFIFSATLALMPFWSTALPAATDLPQHLAQTWLLDETIAGHRPELMVTPWYYPNTLIYWVLYGLWKIFPPLVAGRLILSLLAVLWIAGTFALLKLHRRPVENWLIAVPIVFNFLFNWGLLNFLVGWPVFCAFLLAASAPPFKGQPILIVAIALLLYFAHALWFAMATLWLTIMLVGIVPAQRIRLGCAMLPGWMMALFWYPSLTSSRRDSGVDTGFDWVTMPLERLNFGTVADSVFGSIVGDVEPFALTVLLLWIALVIVTRWRQLKSESDFPMLVAALLMIFCYWVLPGKYMNTIFFNQRWLPFGTTLLLLALPAPKLRPVIPFATGVSLLGLLSATTAKAWHDWEEEHLAGFFEALANIEQSDKILALNVNDGSLNIKGRPGTQLFAYAQALNKADIFFSFTEHYSGPVHFRSPPPKNRERELVWAPGTVTRDNIAGYSKIIINGNDAMHQYFSRKLDIVPINPSSGMPWRVYRPVYPSSRSYE